jgi:hypothetical protein
MRSTNTRAKAPGRRLQFEECLLYSVTPVFARAQRHTHLNFAVRVVALDVRELGAKEIEVIPTRFGLLTCYLCRAGRLPVGLSSFLQIGRAQKEK